MKKDIKFLPVEGVIIAVTKETDELNDPLWNVYLINRNEFRLENVFIRSKGYGSLNEEKQETSVLRHHFVAIEPGHFALVEPIDPNVFHLNNEYWISYFVNNQIFDKKFIFLPDTIIEENLIEIPELNLKGVLHV